MKVVLPQEMSEEDYCRYITPASDFSKGRLPNGETLGVKLTYSPLSQMQKNNLLLFSTNNAFTADTSVVVGDIDVFDSPIPDSLHLIYAMQRFVKVRETLAGNNHCEIPKVLRARRNDPHYMQEALNRLYGGNILQVDKFDVEEGLNDDQILDRLVTSNKDM